MGNLNVKFTKNASKVLAIGLDGATFKIINPFVKKGLMPNVARIMKNGMHGTLLSTVPPLTAPAWASFITGKNPGKHGIYSFLHKDPRKYESKNERPVNSKDIKGQTIWEIISKKGKKVGIINVPLTYPPTPVNGFMITGMLTPRNTNNFTYPSQLLTESFPSYKIDLEYGKEVYGDFSKYDFKEDIFLQDLEELLDMRLKVCLNLIKNKEWNFFMVVFTETDRIQHFFWHYFDNRSNIIHKPSNTKRYQRLFEQFFSKVDVAVGKLVNSVGDNTTIIILSDHGFGSSPKKNFFVNVWLENLGLLNTTKQTTFTANPYYWANKMGITLNKIREIARLFLPDKFVYRMRQNLSAKFSLPIDWSRTKAYFVNLNQNIGGIEINTKGKNENCIIKDDQKYEKIRDFILKKLKEIRDPQTGFRIVSAAYKRENLYSGPYVNRAPDIVFFLDPQYTNLGSLAKSSIVAPLKMFRRSGEHRQQGILIITGPDIRIGQFNKEYHIEDLAPTILYLLGIPVPREMDGKLIAEAFNRDALSRSPIVYTSKEIKEFIDNQKSESNKEDIKKIKERLKYLGYLD